MMKRNIRKAYGLVGGQGSTFYDFSVMGSEGKSLPSTADMGEVKRIREWFRNGTDTGVGNDVRLKEALLDEAMRAFALLKDIFDEIKAPGLKAQKPVTHLTPSDPEPKSSGVFSVSSVVTFMLAVGLAHFIIVVGGLSGTRGYAKLEDIHAWVTGTVPSSE